MARARGRTIALVAFAAAVVWLAPGSGHSQGVESERGEQNSESPDEPSETTAAEPVWLGVQIGEDADDSGASVREVIDGSPAARVGLESDDRIVAVDGQKVDDLSSLREALAPHGPGDRVDIEFRRGDEDRTVTATLSARPTKSALMRRQLVGASLPSVAFEDLEGDRHDPADHRGKPLVLEFWATWCRPCRATQKTLSKLDEKFGDRIAILGVSSEKRQLLRKYRKQADLPYSIVRDPDESAHEKLLVSRYPTVIVVDPEGTIAEVFVGIDHREKLTSTLDEMLDDTSSDE